ncbi:unnamed protein product [Gongylonema pulchrum]|uniref:AAA domain-containing protein n=1 Tax=Gongylonema pulchrum TaxID=637853 RepID=A0A183DQH8_9BILA|nr:unnamed protein product [Gongylonema pulchrum]
MRATGEELEKQWNLKRDMLNQGVLNRLTQRISVARKRRYTGFTCDAADLKILRRESCENMVSLTPPDSAIPFIDSVEPVHQKSCYILMRDVKANDDVQNTLGKGLETFNFQLAEKISLDAVPVNDDSSVVPEVGTETVESEQPSSSSFTDKELWVEKYAPHSYVDLISDENVNRTLLKWVRLWDECVFQRTVPEAIFRAGENEHQLLLNNEKPRRPLHKVVLIAGPAGCGKTTLSCLVAEYAGYRVLSLNASDERNVADFEKYFGNTLRSTRTLDADSRPLCFVLDEIDGAPAQSIRFLCKAIAATGKRSLRRPVICICNNLLISKLEHLQAEKSALDEIIAACTQDLRSSINTLQFIASENRGLVTRQAVRKFFEINNQSGDSTLYDSWSSVFEFRLHMNKDGQIPGPASRLRRIASLTDRHGSESDRFYLGLFSNYLSSPNTSLLPNVSAAITQFCYYDRLVTFMNRAQDYRVMKYLCVVSAAIHLLMCSRARVQLNFPSELQDIAQRHQQSVEITESIRAGAAQKNLTLTAVLLEILPYLIHIVQPNFKPATAHLYSAREHNILRSVVSVMRSYSLTYMVVSQDGSASFTFQPAIDTLVMFDEDAACLASRPVNRLSDTAKQLIARQRKTVLSSTYCAVLHE